MFKNVDSIIWQNVGVIIWQKAGATVSKNAEHYDIILCSIV